MTQPADTPPPPMPGRWWPTWLALLPVAPPLVLLGVLGLGRWQQLPRPALLLAGFYLSTQGLAALLSPQPGLALGAAAGRSALLLGLLALGAALGSPRHLRGLGWGLGAVYLTALLSGLALQGWDLMQLRLSHPYYTPVSLGLAGAVGLWLALAREKGESWRTGLLWRVPLGGLALVTALLSGSRGPLFTALLGAGLLTTLQWGRAAGPRAALAGGLLAVSALALPAALPERLQGSALQRLTTLDLTGRDLVWSDTLSAVQAFPWGGTGPLLLGPRLAPPGGQCTWFEALEVRGIGCPGIVEQFNNAWLIAHNGALQALGETGLIGTAGLFLLLGGVLAAAVAGRRPLVLTLLVGLLVADLTDNVTLLPGPFFSAAFWLAAGWALSHWKDRRPDSVTTGAGAGLPTAAAWGAGVLLLTAFPLWASFVPSPVPAGSLHVAAAVSPIRWRNDEPYAAAAQFRAPPGNYRAQLRACRVSCVTVATRPFRIEAGRTSDWQWFIGPLPAPRQVGTGREAAGVAPAGTYRLELRLWPGTSAPWRTRPLASRSWDVQVQPGGVTP